MNTTEIKYNKELWIIAEREGVTSITKKKIGDLPEILAPLECFSMVLAITVLNKTKKLIAALGFEIHEDQSWGFDWETKLICTK